MKKILLILIILTFHQINYAQSKVKEHLPSANFNKYLKEAYGNYASRFYENPKRLDVMKTLYEYRIIIATEKVSKEDKLPKLSSVPLLNIPEMHLKRDPDFTLSSFNPFKYQLPFFTGINAAYRIDDTDYVLYIVSQFTK